MIVGPPIPWHLVPVGAVALIDGTPRTVLVNLVTGDACLVFLEGGAPLTVHRGAPTNLVTLDDIDAIGNLINAGFTIEPVRE